MNSRLLVFIWTLFVAERSMQDNPGTDRVVFNPNLNGECVYVGAMTHSGAEQRNGFVECEMKEVKDDDDSAGIALCREWYAGVLGLAACWMLGM